MISLPEKVLKIGTYILSCVLDLGFGLNDLAKINTALLLEETFCWVLKRKLRVCDSWTEQPLQTGEHPDDLGENLPCYSHEQNDSAFMNTTECNSKIHCLLSLGLTSYYWRREV